MITISGGLACKGVRLLPSTVSSQADVKEVTTGNVSYQVVEADRSSFFDTAWK